jgi:O-succinylbenzoate synthase
MSKADVIEKRLEKLEKKMSDTEVSEIKVMDSKKLKDVAFELSKKLEEIESTKQADEKYQAAKQAKADFDSAYRDLLSPIKTQLSYIHLVIQNKELAREE